MTYCGYYRHPGTGAIVVAQDTVVVDKTSHAVVFTADKVYHHAQGNLLVASLGDLMGLELAISRLNEEMLLDYNAALLRLTAIMVAARETQFARHPDALAQAIAANSITFVLVFGYEPDGEPRLTRFTFSGEQQVIPEVDDLSAHLQDGALHSLPHVAGVDHRQIPKVTRRSHRRGYRLARKLARRNDGDNLLRLTALLGHMLTCHKSVTEGGWGAGIGGELIAYQIDPSGIYGERHLLNFPENTHHGIPDEIRIRMTDIEHISGLNDPTFLRLTDQGKIHHAAP